MAKKALIIGGGPAGCASAYFLGEKGWECTIIEASDGLGGMSRTKYCNGHPYEFGPHLWFWPHDNINDVIKYLGGEMLNLERRLYSYADGVFARYPLHWNDITAMSDFYQIKAELVLTRDENMRLIPEKLPKVGECTFAEYFRAVVGPTLYHRFMERYTHKMWGIDGDTLTTKMVWADRIKSAYTGEPYDPIKFEDQGLGKGLVNWYPKNGWNPVWEGMANRATCFLNTKVENIGPESLYVRDTHGEDTVYHTSDFEAVIWTIHTDALFVSPILGGQSRVVLPMVFPGRIRLPKNTESLHLSDRAPVTRITDMSMVTGVGGNPDNNGVLYLFELPGVVAKDGADAYVDQWYVPRCYNQLSDHNIEMNKQLSIDLRDDIPNIHFCGRAAEYQYYGMPQVVNSALMLAEKIG